MSVLQEWSIEGNWWIYGQNRPAQAGILTFNKESGINLKVFVPHSISVNDVFSSLLQEANSDPIVRTIVGRDESNSPVTLYGCYGTPSVSTGRRSYKIEAIAAIRGLELQSWSTAAIRTVELDVQYLHRWLGGQVLKGAATPDGRTSFMPPEDDDLVFDVCHGVRFRIARHIASSMTADEFKWTPCHRIYLHFEEAQPLSLIADKWVPWVTHLFSMLIGTGVRAEHIVCHANDPFDGGSQEPTQGGELIQTGGKRRTRVADPHSSRMLATFPDISSSFGDVIRRWHEVASRLEPVVDQFTIVVFNLSLHPEAELLFLVQALEVFHARSGHFESTVLPREKHLERLGKVVESVPTELKEWTRRSLQGANYKYLNERLSEIFESYSQESKRLFGDSQKMSEKIRYTRNHLTHYGGDIDDPRYLGDTELTEANWKLEVFLWIILLKEIGVSGKAIERLLRREENVHFIGL